jgi:excisionase family DNA binding protein
MAPNSRKFAAGLLLETKRGGAAPDEPLLSVADVALQLAVSKATVYGLCTAGKLPHVRIMNVLRMRPADVRAFIEASMNSAR